MKIKDLIKELKNYDEDCEVLIECDRSVTRISNIEEIRFKQIGRIHSIDLFDYDYWGHDTSEEFQKADKGILISCGDFYIK